jgi:tetratricopeptide (TPR) repeat protein
VAYHFQRAGDPRAEVWLVKSGERAQAVGAWLEAAGRYESALTLNKMHGDGAITRAWLLYRAARMRRYDDPRRALSSMADAARLAAGADPALAAVVAFDRGLCRAYLGETERALAEMAGGVAALEALPTAERAKLRALEPLGVHNRRGTLVMWLGTVGRFAEAVATGEPYLAEAEAAAGSSGLHDSAYGDAYATLGQIYSVWGRPDNARVAFAHAREIYAASGHRANVINVACTELRLIGLVYHADDAAVRRRLLAEVAAGRAWARDVQPGVPVEAQLWPLLYYEGRWAEARALALAQRDAEMLALRLVSALILVWLGLAQGEGSPRAAARAWLPTGPVTGPGRLPIFAYLSLQRLAAADALTRGDLREAQDWLVAHDKWLDQTGMVVWRAEGQLSWADYHRKAGDLSTAFVKAERALFCASEPRQPLALLAAHRLLGELDAVIGRHTDALAHLDAALALADACAAPYERALTLLALADVQALMGAHGPALAALGEAESICGPLQARPALARATAIRERVAVAW